MKQAQSGELKASLGASKLIADQLRIRELERKRVALPHRIFRIVSAHSLCQREGQSGELVSKR